MNHDTLRVALLRAMGDKVHVGARESWAAFIRSEATEFWIDYDWIRNQRFYEWLWKSNDYDFGEGVQGLRIWIRQT